MSSLKIQLTDFVSPPGAEELERRLTKARQAKADAFACMGDVTLNGRPVAEAQDQYETASREVVRLESAQARDVARRSDAEAKAAEEAEQECQKQRDAALGRLKEAAAGTDKAIRELADKLKAAKAAQAGVLPLADDEILNSIADMNFGFAPCLTGALRDLHMPGLAASSFIPDRPWASLAPTPTPARKG